MTESFDLADVLSRPGVTGISKNSTYQPGKTPQNARLLPGNDPSHTTAPPDPTPTAPRHGTEAVGRKRATVTVLPNGSVYKLKEKMRSTEKDYFHVFLYPRLVSGELRAVLFEGSRFVLMNGHAYTVDFYCIRPDMVKECHEVKGSYRLHSQQASRMNFDLARTDWPDIKWFWSVKGKGHTGSWKIEVY